MKNRRAICYLIAMTFVVIWLIFSTNIIIKLNRLTVPETIGVQSIDVMPNVKINGFIETIRMSGLLKGITFQGWIFSEDEINENVSDRHFSIVFNGNQQKYELPLSRDINRAGVRATYPQYLTTDEVGYERGFSTFNIQDGVYDILLCSRKDTEALGWISTEYQFEKKDGECSVYLWKSAPVAYELMPTQSDLARRCIDSVAFSGQRIAISGWAFVEGQDSTTQKTYILLADRKGDKKLFTTRSWTRKDVAKAFNNSFYENSGYAASIPYDPSNVLADGTWTLQILVENEGKVWGSEERTLIKSGDKIELVQ